MIDNVKIANQIKKLCKEKNTSVKEMLKKCQINEKYIYDVEKRGVIPSIEKIDSMANYLGCSIDYLLGRENPVIEQLQNELAQKNRVIEQIKDLICNEKVIKNS